MVQGEGYSSGLGNIFFFFKVEDRGDISPEKSQPFVNPAPAVVVPTAVRFLFEGKVPNVSRLSCSPNDKGLHVVYLHSIPASLLLSLFI